jgi:hypothetical protein
MASAFNTLELPQSPQYEQVGYDEYIRQLNESIRIMKENGNVAGLRSAKATLMNRTRRNTQRIKRLPGFEIVLPQNNVNAEMIRVMTEKYNREHLNTKPIQDYFKTRLVHNEKIRNIEQAIHNIQSRPVPQAPINLRPIYVDPMLLAPSAWKKEQITPLLAEKEARVQQLHTELRNILKEIYADSDRYSFGNIPEIKIQLGRELARLESRRRKDGKKWGRVLSLLGQVTLIDTEYLQLDYDIRVLRSLLENINAEVPSPPASPPSNLIFGSLEGGRKRRHRRTVKNRRS